MKFLRNSFYRRCRAYRPPGHPDGYFGRCDLQAGHKGTHALERGMEVWRWSTDGHVEVGTTVRAAKVVTDVAGIKHGMTKAT